MLPTDFIPRYHRVDPEEKVRSDARMRVMDEINRKMGGGGITIASVGIRHRWAMRRELKSQDFTTDWEQLLRAG